jgi:DNA-binding transcriptional MerR regulator
MEANGHSEQNLPAKNLFRIGEVSRLTATKPFVLRFWETEFPMLQPVKSPKGHRLYRRQDIETVFVIKRLLYDEGFTIAGARRHLRDQAAEPNGSNGDTARTGAGSTWSSPETGAGSTWSPPEKGHAAQPSLALNRKTLLDLRDSLRSLLTVLESE